MISIELSVVSGRYLDELLESLRAQAFQDYELVIVNSNPECPDKIRDFGGKEIFRNTGKLEARKIAHEASKGEFELLLEETRFLSPDTLKNLSSLENTQLAIINELEVGDKLINKINRLSLTIVMFLYPREASKYIISKSLATILETMSDGILE